MMRSWLNWKQGEKDSANKDDDKNKKEQQQQQQPPPQSQDGETGGRLTRGSRGGFG